MGLDDVELGRDEPAWLEQDGIGHAHLSDVVKRRRPLDRLGIDFGEPERPGQQTREPADSSRVLAGVVIPVFGGAREPLDDLEMRAVQRLGPVEDGLFELLLLAFELRVQLARHEQVADPQERFDAVERLGEEVAGAHRQRALLDRGRVVGGHDEDRQVAFGGEQGANGLHHLEAVHVRHVEVEDDQVRPDLGEPRDRVARIGDAAHVLTASAAQQPIEHPHVPRLVVHDEDTCGSKDIPEGHHEVMTWSGVRRLSHGIAPARPCVAESGARQPPCSIAGRHRS